MDEYRNDRGWETNDQRTGGRSGEQPWEVTIRENRARNEAIRRQLASDGVEVSKGKTSDAETERGYSKDPKTRRRQKDYEKSIRDPYDFSSADREKMGRRKKKEIPSNIMTLIGAALILLSILLLIGFLISGRGKKDETPEVTTESAADAAVTADGQEAGALATGPTATQESDDGGTTISTVEEAKALLVDVPISASSINAIGKDRLFFAEPISETLAKRMTGFSYLEGARTKLADLSYLRMLYVDFEGKSHLGEMVVNTQIADRVMNIFKQLYDAKYPIHHMELVDNYEADDKLSMEANNTSAYKCRTFEGEFVSVSHARGLGIDINPLFNPYIGEDGTVVPESASMYADRQTAVRGMIDKGDLCYKLFTENGFLWGGDFTSVKDYQHFEYVGGGNSTPAATTTTDTTTTTTNTTTTETDDAEAADTDAETAEDGGADAETEAEAVEEIQEEEVDN